MELGARHAKEEREQKAAEAHQLFERLQQSAGV